MRSALLQDRSRKRHLKVLVLDPSESEAGAVATELRYYGFDLEMRWVSSVAAFSEQLEASPWDIILCDSSLFGSAQDGAFGVYRSKGLDGPFFVMSSDSDEERASVTMGAGAHDYFQKRHMSRLGASVDRELREADIRIAKRRSEQRLAESETRFQTLADTAPVIIWATDADGVRNYVNRQWLEYTGEPLRRGRSEAWTGLVHPEDYEHRLHQWNIAFENRKAYQAEFRLRRHDGVYRWFISRGVAQYSEQGDFTGYIGTSTDVGAVKDAEAALRKHNERLQRLAFVAAHDMREPLRTVKIYTQLLERRYGDRLDDSAHEFMSYVTAGVERIGKLMDDLLVYAETNLGHQHQTLVSLEEAKQTALHNLAERLAHSGATVLSEPLPVVRGDARQMVLLFENLLANAVKFRADRPLTIQIRADQDGGEWRIAVADNGIGIAAEYRERVFELFKRLHGPAYSGTGVGLTLCQTIVENHGGRIWTTGNEDGGATFWFTLPEATISAA